MSPLNKDELRTLWQLVSGVDVTGKDEEFFDTCKRASEKLYAELHMTDKQMKVGAGGLVTLKQKADGTTEVHIEEEGAFTLILQRDTLNAIKALVKSELI